MSIRRIDKSVDLKNIGNTVTGLSAELAQNATKLKKVTGTINVAEYGFIGDGISHPLSESYSTLASAQVDYPVATALTDEKDWCAIQHAVNVAAATGYASGKGSTVVFPYCKAIINKQIIVKNASLRGDAQGTELHFERFGNGTSEISGFFFDYDYTIGAQRRPTVENIIFTGDGGYYNLGVRGTYLNGVEVGGDSVVTFINCIFKYFNKGTIWSNSGGWIVYERCYIQENYYGVYCKRNNGDYRLSHTNVVRNNFACFVTNASTGFQGLVMRDGHCGFSPYGFYCEPEPSNSTNGNQNRNVFLKDVMLDHCRFEHVGNGAIFCDDSQGATPLSAGLHITNAGFSWDDTGNTFQIASRKRDYAIDLATVDGSPVFVNSGAWRFLAGDKNIFRVRNLLGNINVVGNEPSNSVDVVSGSGLVCIGQNYQMVRSDGMIIPKTLGGSFCQTVTNNSSVTFTPSFVNNPNKRFKIFIMVDMPGDCYGELFHDGSGLYATGTIGSKLAFGAANPSTASKLNIYVSSAGVIGINNLLGSDRKVSISVEGFY